jgi:hypothetical protein
MKNLLFFFAFSLFFLTFSFSQPVIGLFDELKEIYPDTKIGKPQTELSTDCAKGTIAGVHILLTDLQSCKNLKFDISGKYMPKNISWYRMINVPVTENTGLNRATEKFLGKTNPYVIRRAPFSVYEALMPVNSPVEIDSQTIALRLEIPLDASFPNGKHEYKIQLSIDGRETNLKFTINVYKPVVPPLSKSNISYVNWFSLDNMCKDHRVEKWSEPFWEILKKYADIMVKGRQNTTRFAWTDFISINNNGEITGFEGKRLERFINLFLSSGLQIIQGAPFLGRIFWGDSNMIIMNIKDDQGKNVTADSEKGKKIIKGMAKIIIDFMKNHKWENRWFQGVFDEPTEEFVTRYKDIITLLRELKPDIQILEATMTTDLAGYVNNWCPQVQEYQHNRSFFEERKKSGDKVWVYTCLEPGGPWLNRLCDMERLRPVYIGWACAKYNLNGYLHWGLNKHNGHPFTELVRYHTLGQYLPAGDSHILYPILSGPLSSQRFEAHRIGMEDYELLNQFMKIDSVKTQAIIQKVFQAFDEYSKDINIYREAKHEILTGLDAGYPKE